MAVLAAATVERVPEGRNDNSSHFRLADCGLRPRQDLEGIDRTGAP
jgi:hypothetical protein